MFSYSGGFFVLFFFLMFLIFLYWSLASPVAQQIKDPLATQETQVQSLRWEGPLEEEMAAHSSILAGESHGQRSLAGCSPRGCRELDTTERAHIVSIAVFVLSIQQPDQILFPYRLLQKSELPVLCSRSLLIIYFIYNSVASRSVQLCDPMDSSMPGFLSPSP